MRKRPPATEGRFLGKFGSRIWPRRIGGPSWDAAQLLRQISGEVVVQDASVGKHEVHDLMAPANNPSHGQVGDATVYMRDEVQARRPIPGTVHVNVLEVVPYQLGDFWLSIDVG